MSKPRLSLIICFYNAQNYLKRSIDSFYDYLNDDIEVVFVNDGSSDNSLQVIKDYNFETPIKVISLEHNQGTSIARDFGVKNSKGEIIVFLDADDEYIDNPFKYIIKEFEDEYVDVLYFRSIDDNEFEDEYINSGKLLSNNGFLDYLYGQYFLIPLWRYAFKRHLFDETVFIKSYQLFEDNIATPLLLFKSKQIRTIQDVFHRRHLDNPNSSMALHMRKRDQHSKEVQKQIMYEKLVYFQEKLKPLLDDNELDYYYRFQYQTLLNLFTRAHLSEIRSLFKEILMLKIKMPRVFGNYKVAFRNSHKKINLTLFLFGFKYTAIVATIYSKIRLRLEKS